MNRIISCIVKTSFHCLLLFSSFCGTECYAAQGLRYIKSPEYFQRQPNYTPGIFLAGSASSDWRKDFYEEAKSHDQKGFGANAILKAMGLKERWGIRLLSHGHLSRINMVKAVIRDVESE